MEYVILDLEWNGTYSRRLKGFMNEIIEFGAVKVDESMTVLESFDMLVRPQVGKKLSGKIKKLTNISNEELTTGEPFTKVLSLFRKWMGDAVLMTWGTSDILALMENCRYFTGSERIPFLKQYADMQIYCEKRLNYDQGRQMGLSTAAQLAGIDEEGVDHHRALDDSMLSLEIFRTLYDKESFLPFIQDATDDEFYRKLSFKTVVLCDLTNPLIDTGVMYFNCELCGRRAVRLSEWELKNKVYRAGFVCEHCKREFKGKIQFKLKYEGVVVKKRTAPMEQKTEEPDGMEEENS